MASTTYADAGVHIELGDDVSRLLYNAARLTWENRKGRLGELIIPFDDFSGVRAIDVSGLPAGSLMNIGFDGIGTKAEIAERAKNHRTMAYDLLAMVCDDAVVRGAEPVLVGSILDVKSLQSATGSFVEEVKQLAEGYVGAAKAANVAIVNGEVAELGSRIGGYGPFNYNWGAAVVWFAQRERLLTGHQIQKGDYLVGLREHGFRSNGLSLVRKIMSQHHGEVWHRETYNDQRIADLVLHPSRIYSAAVVAMFGGFDQQPRTQIHGVAHVTGGGIPGKLGRILKPSGLGAHLDDLFEPPEFMKYVQFVGNVPDQEAYKTWNMGQGMIIISPYPEGVMTVAGEYGIESQVIGKITSKPGIRIATKGVFASPGEELIF